eukprot:TRINITY_DN2765_c0_g1_i1.p1 TRINITY_DN2765_c0_g1~~TRINITY_DN2765_c0_g1_i1.p1  ORF type:complete len:324 (+),score=56.80 TRINITY_DN2765_c0_g1_i1:20-991(+)
MFWRLFDDRPWKVKLMDGMMGMASIGAPDIKEDPMGYLLKVQEFTLNKPDAPSDICKDVKVEVSPDFTNDLRIYTPSTPPASPKGFPLLIWLHGGGYCFGTYKDSADYLTAIAKTWHGMVISIGYRLAPQHKYPTGLNDVVGTVKHLFLHADQFHFDASNVFIGGESAGATLSALTAHRLREESPEMQLRGVLLNCGCPRFKRDLAEGSPYASGYILNTDMTSAFRVAYVEDPGEWQTDPLLSFRVPLGGLPPFLLHIAELDVMAAQSMAFAEELKRENGEHNVALKIFKEVPHGFCSLMFMWKDETLEEIDHLVKWMNGLVQ